MYSWEREWFEERDLIEDRILSDFFASCEEEGDGED